MRIKVLSVIVCLVIVGWLYTYFNDQNHDQVNSKSVLKPIKTGLTEPKNSPPSIELETTEKQEMADVLESDYTQSQQEILAEISPYKYSVDPYVEMLTLKLVIDNCMLKDFQVNYSKAQKLNNYEFVEMLPTFEQRCQKYRQRYPKLISKFQSQEARTLFKPQSELGHLFNINFENLSRSEIEAQQEKISKAILKTQNSGLLLARAMARRWGYGAPQEIIVQLDTQDKTYAGSISYMAMALLSCDFSNGELCTYDSSLMQSNCLQSPRACGLDFLTWYQQNTLPGMQKDVEKLMDYYRQQGLN